MWNQTPVTAVFFLFFCEPESGYPAPAVEFLGSLTDGNSGSRQLHLELFIGFTYQGQFTGSDFTVKTGTIFFFFAVWTLQVM